MPWFGWVGMDASAGFVTISSVTKPEMRGATGLTLISTESARAGVTAAPRHLSTYRVDDPRKLGEIVWESIPARVSVAIESQMTIDADSAEWVAVLRYDVIGGASTRSDSGCPRRGPRRPSFVCLAATIN